MTLYHISIKKIIKHCTFSILVTSLLLSSAAFSGCSLKNATGTTDTKSQEPISATAIKLNTAVTVTIYDSQNRELLTECMNLCDKYEKIFSRTASDSELYKLNHRGLTPVAGTEDTFQVSDSLAKLIKKGLSYSELSEGAFDIAIEPLTSLWDFTAEDPQVPEDALIQKALQKCDYHNVSVNDKNEVTLKTDDTAIELGAIAKGYIADRLKDYLISQDVKSAIINLGGNVYALGRKPDGSRWRIGIKDPNDVSNVIGSIELENCAAVTSGTYDRSFVKNGKRYHHILSPSTGKPVDSDVASVTITSPSALTAEGYSTTLLCLGKHDGVKFAQSKTGIMQAFFIDNTGEIAYARREPPRA